MTFHYTTVNRHANERVLTFSVKGPGAAIWGYVNFGTKAHIIRPKVAPALAFQTGYTPRTKPKVFASGKAARFGPFVFAQEVHHPGGKARNWHIAIRNQHGAEFQSDIQNSVKRSNRR